MNLMVWAVLLAAVLLANLPFLNRRVLALSPWTRLPRWWFRPAEFLLCYGVWLVLSRAIEASQGQLAPQGWQFYAVTLSMFVVAGFPGFVWQFLWRKPSRPSPSA